MKAGAPVSADLCPADVDEERATLGSLIVCVGTASNVHLLREDDFSLSSHRAVYRAITRLVAAGEANLDYLLLCQELRRLGELESVGGAAFVSELGNLVVCARDFGSRVRILRELGRRRQLLRAAEELTVRAADLTSPVGATVAWLRAEVEK